MEYYLRVEAVNLSNFVYDTADLATIRGGSLLLLDAMDLVEEIIKKRLPETDPKNIVDRIKSINYRLERISHIAELSKSEQKKEKNTLRKRKKKLQLDEKSDKTCLATITKGASWGLFRFDTKLQAVKELITDVKDTFAGHRNYKHATFVVNLYQAVKESEEYTLCRAKAQTLNRWQQLHEPALAICREGDDVCTFDKVRPALNDRKCHKAGEEKPVYCSQSVAVRREYGQKIKKSAKDFYVKRTGNTAFNDLQLTADLSELSSCEEGEEYVNLHNKIAFIYIDGNEFGKKQRKCITAEQQKEFDLQTRKGREKLLNEILLAITADRVNYQWFNDNKLRLETLLWGGDEIIWVVPAWQGWWMLKNFYRLAEQYIQLKDNAGQIKERLYHGASLVFCNHKAPIAAIDSLARSLADGFAKRAEFKKSNMFAYQVLESFDHAGTDLAGHRKMLINGLSDNVSDLLIDGEKMEAIEACISKLKEVEFSRRKMYQIIQSRRRNKISSAEEFHKKLSVENDSDSTQKKNQKKEIKNQLDTLREIFNNSEIFWLHLIELWDYVALEPAADKKEGE